MARKRKKSPLVRLLAMTIGILCLLPIWQFKSQGQIKTSLTITGNVKELKKGTKLCLLIKKAARIDTIAKSIAKEELFVFKDIQIPYFPDFYSICIQTEFVDNLQLFLDQKGNIKITGELGKWPNVKVTGSKTHDDYLAATKIRRKVFDEDFAANYPGKSAPIDTILMYSKKGISQVINRMPESYYIPAMLAAWTYTAAKIQVPVELKKPFYKQLSYNQKQSYYGKILAKQIGIKD